MEVIDPERADANLSAPVASTEQAAAAVWLTGLSASGKSTIANHLVGRLRAAGRQTYVLDGDNLRCGLNRDLGFTATDRSESVRRVAEVARLMVDAGVVVIVALISPFRADRRMAREVIGPRSFCEVFVDTPLAIAEARDPKGLYRKARSGQIPNFTGIDSPYEAPEHPNVHVDTTRVSPMEAAQHIMVALQSFGQGQSTEAAATRQHSPFFIVGAQRSGTTMLRLMLNSHPELAVPFESGFIVEFHKRLPQYGDIGGDLDARRRLLTDIATHPLVRKGGLIQDFERILAHPVSTYADFVHAIFDTYARARGKQRWGDKTPSYVEEIDSLRTIFPRARIVHLVRDGRDVALSNRQISWGIRNLPRAAADWRWKTLVAHKMGTILGSDYLLVRFEDLVLHTEPTLRRIVDFLGILYSHEMLEYPRTASADVPPDSLQWHRRSIESPNPDLVHHWRRTMSRSDRIIFEQVAGDALRAFGYELEARASTVASRVKNLYFSTVARY